MGKKLTTKEFIKRSKEIHNNKYNYSLVNYENGQKKVKIICSIHGIFEQRPYAHLQKQSCPKCNKYNKNDIYDFINISNNIHNNKYDYSLVNYKNSHKKVKIICSIHGIFEQRPSNHINEKQGCPICAGVKKLTTNEFIKKSIEIHGDKYDYSLVNYINNKTKVKIICPLHGIFEQMPNSHYNRGSICPKCSIEKSIKKKEFIEKSIEIHNNKYDYSLTEYKRQDKKIKIICPKHGIFEQTPYSHLIGRGCPICNGNMKLNNNQIKILFNEIHDNKYDYSLVNYINNKTKIKIICPKHGIFEQTPAYHKIGNGCPNCNESKGEKIIRKYLDNKNIKYIYQKKIDGCKDINNLIFDFYLPDYKICIEYDGEQHFNVNEFFGGLKRLINQQKKDTIKNDFCKNSNIKLIRIRYDENIEKILNENNIVK